MNPRNIFLWCEVQLEADCSCGEIPTTQAGGNNVSEMIAAFSCLFTLPSENVLNYFNFMHYYIYYTGWWAGFGNDSHVSGVVMQGMSDSCVMAHMPKES